MKLKGIYEHLKRLYLTSSYTEFSRKWCKRSHNYFSDSGVYRDRYPSSNVLENIIINLDHLIHFIKQLPINTNTSFQENIHEITELRNLLADSVISEKLKNTSVEKGSNINM